MTNFVEIFVEGYPEHNYPLITDVSKVPSVLKALDEANKDWKLGKFIISK